MLKSCSQYKYTVSLIIVSICTLDSKLLLNKRLDISSSLQPDSCSIYGFRLKGVFLHFSKLRYIRTCMMLLSLHDNLLLICTFSVQTLTLMSDELVARAKHLIFLHQSLLGLFPVHSWVVQYISNSTFIWRHWIGLTCRIKVVRRSLSLNKKKTVLKLSHYLFSLVTRSTIMALKGNTPQV